MEVSEIGGFDQGCFYNLPESVAKYMSCSICSFIYDNAVTTDCGHSFCKECIQNTIENYDNKECPECRAPFMRKRARSAGKLIIIGQYVFKTNYIVNGVIGDLEVKCHFQFNGCQQPIKLEDMSSHIKECEHRFCLTCGFTAGKPGEHNCVQLLKKDQEQLKKDKEDLKKEREQLIKEREELNMRLTEQKSNLDKEINLLSEFIKLTYLYKAMFIDKFKLKKGLFEINSSGIKLFSPNNIMEDIYMPFNQLDEVKYCSDPTHPAVILKTTESFPLKIEHALQLNMKSINFTLFSIESKDLKQRYIVIELNMVDEDNHQKLITYLDYKSKEMKFVRINLSEFNKLMGEILIPRCNNLEEVVEQAKEGKDKVPS